MAVRPDGRCQRSSGWVSSQHSGSVHPGDVGVAIRAGIDVINSTGDHWYITRVAGSIASKQPIRALDGSSASGLFLHLRVRPGLLGCCFGRRCVALSLRRVARVLGRLQITLGRLQTRFPSRPIRFARRPVRSGPSTTQCLCLSRSSCASANWASVCSSSSSRSTKSSWSWLALPSLLDEHPATKASNNPERTRDANFTRCLLRPEVGNRNVVRTRSWGERPRLSNLPNSSGDRNPLVRDRRMTFRRRSLKGHSDRFRRRIQ